jgi:hypothetical protein
VRASKGTCLKLQYFCARRNCLCIPSCLCWGVELRLESAKPLRAMANQKEHPTIPATGRRSFVGVFATKLTSWHSPPVLEPKMSEIPRTVDPRANQELISQTAISTDGGTFKSFEVETILIGPVGSEYYDTIFDESRARLADFSFSGTHTQKAPHTTHTQKERTRKSRRFQLTLTWAILADHCYRLELNARD